MVTVEEVAALVRRQVGRKVPADAVLEENTVLDELGLSSLEVAEVVFSLEEQYELAFDEARAADVKTLGDVVALANEALEADQKPLSVEIS